MTEEISSVFLQQGPIGALCLLLFGAIVVLYREMRKGEAGWREDMRIVVKALEHNSATLAAISTAMENRTRATDTMAQAVAVLSRDVEDLTKDIENLTRRP